MREYFLSAVLIVIFECVGFFIHSEVDSTPSEYVVKPTSQLLPPTRKCMYNLNGFDLNQGHTRTFDLLGDEEPESIGIFDLLEQNNGLVA